MRKLSVLSATALAAALLASGPAPAAPQDWAPAALTSPSPATTLAQAFDYAFPLVMMGRLRAAALGTDAQPGRQRLNVWQHARKLAGPDDRAVTTPNTDTLYSTVWLDLRRGPVTLSVPDTDGRYYSLAFIDPRTDNFAMAGRRVSGTRAGSWVVVGPGSSQPVAPGLRVIRAPSDDVLVLSRILVDGAADLPAVAALQDQFRVDPPAAPVGPLWSAAPPAGTDAQAFVDLANQMLARAPAPAYEQALLQRFASVGICGAACSWDKLSPQLQAEWTQRLPALQAALRGGLGTTPVDGWRYARDTLGNFGTDYAYRAQIALAGLLALEPAEAMYPSTGSDGQGRPLDGAQRYRLRLPAGTPPVNAFWSLSMYEVQPDGKMFFTANPIERYAIGDRTAGLVRNADGAIDIWIQHQQPADPAQRANWLPAPTGQFQLVLRAYEPQAAMRDGRVRLTPVERLD